MRNGRAKKKMEVSQVFKCPCNDKVYPSLKSLKTHQKTKLHRSWEDANELKNLKKELTRRDNKIMQLENNITTLIELNNMLMEKINAPSSP